MTTQSTSVNINPELWKEVKKLAIDEGITVREFCERALREGMAKERIQFRFVKECDQDPACYHLERI